MKVLLAAPLFPMRSPHQTEPHVWFATNFTLDTRPYSYSHLSGIGTSTSSTLACDPFPSPPRTRDILFVRRISSQLHHSTVEFSCAVADIPAHCSNDVGKHNYWISDCLFVLARDSVSTLCIEQLVRTASRRTLELSSSRQKNNIQTLLMSCWTSHQRVNLHLNVGIC